MKFHGNVSKRKSLIDKTFYSLSTILRTTEVQIIIILILIGYITIYSKTSFNFSFLNNPIEKSIKSYSFKNATFGFKDDFSLDSEEKNLEKKLLKSLPFLVRVNAKPYIKAILKVSELYQVDPIWVASVVWTESHFKPNALSDVGAHGLMQIMPTTKKYLYKLLKRKGRSLIVERSGFDLRDFFDVSITKAEAPLLIKKIVHLELGVFYLKKLLKRFDNDHHIATIAYNMGPSWTRRKLTQNIPLGKKNHYLFKVTKAYSIISKRI